MKSMMMTMMVGLMIATTGAVSASGGSDACHSLVHQMTLDRS